MTLADAEAAKGGVASLPVVPYEVKYFSQAGKGSHRARVHVSTGASAVRVLIPWRRRDENPQEKAILVFAARKAQEVANVQPIEIRQEYGEIAFEPVAGIGDYFIYYLPYKPARGVFDKAADYMKPKPTAESAWLKANGLDPAGLKAGAWKKLPQAEVKALQSRSEFNRFDPMEVVATVDEVDRLLKVYPNTPYLVFCEDRDHPVKMKRHLPLRWIEAGPSDELELKAQPGEYRPFQIALWTARQPMSSLDLKISDLVGANGRTIPASAIQCVNFGGFDDEGNPYSRGVSVAQGRIQPLWVGIDIPADARGVFTGTIKVIPAGLPAKTVKVRVTVAGEVLDDHGDSDVQRFSRLRWLNSRIGLDDPIPAPYKPVSVNGSVVSILDRQIRFGKTGLPESIRSRGRQVLARPITLNLVVDGKAYAPADSTEEVVHADENMVERQARGKLGSCTLKVESRVEFDGAVLVDATITAEEDIAVEDLSLVVPYARPDATYMMGMGRRGGFRPDSWGWAWDAAREDNEVWVGSESAGMQVKLLTPMRNWKASWRDGREKDNAWYNRGHGGAILTETDKAFTLQAFTGPRTLKKGQPLTLRFRLLITPFHAYEHGWAFRPGINGVRSFQGRMENPFINYPFLTIDKIKRWAAENAKYRTREIYYTNRELASRVAELWILRSLGNEIIRDDEAHSYYDDQAWTSKAGGGHVWLREHLVEEYAPAWRQPLPYEEIDHALGLQKHSRWNNYWLEGLDFIMKNTGVDSLYLDGIANGRIVMRRARQIMKRTHPNSRILNHAGNSYDHGKRVSIMNRQMEVIPYMDKLWYGEGFNYDRSSDYYMVELSGIPFGIAGSMLDYNSGGNIWRGMIYGMQPSSWHKAKTVYWEFLDGFDIEKSRMVGYWEPDAPVSTGCKDILATTYVQDDCALIALASWTKAAHIRLAIDPSKLPFDLKGCLLVAEELPGIQPGKTFELDQEIPVPAVQGLLLKLIPRDKAKRDLTGDTNK